MIHGAAVAFDPYLAQEVAPALRAGYGRGRGRLPSLPAVERMYRPAHLVPGYGDERCGRRPYDSHPPCVNASPPCPGAAGVIRQRSPALSLLADVNTAESKLMGFI